MQEDYEMCGKETETNDHLRKSTKLKNIKWREDLLNGKER